MAKQLRIRRGTTAEIAAFTGAAGEPTFDTTTSRVQIHDGVTPGGINVDRIRITTVAPTAAVQVCGELLHINTANGSVFAWNGTDWVTIIAAP